MAPTGWLLVLAAGALLAGGAAQAGALARVESCRGCSLNRLPEVKKFIYEDLPNYEAVEFKPIQGAPPELVLLGESDEELERIPLSKLSRAECNELLQKKGFTRNDKSNAEL